MFYLYNQLSTPPRAPPLPEGKKIIQEEEEDKISHETFAPYNGRNTPFLMYLSFMR